jgi:DNA-directed RNA polymerase subunit RPC12/RpoP
MVALHPAREPIGDVRCLNCSRSLAQLVPSADSVRLALQPAANQSRLQVIVAGRRLLRCQHCGGRALVELREETPVEELVESMQHR